MPIISFNISDNLKKFLKKMVTQKEYKNSSNVIRDALVRLMDEKDGTGAVAENGDISTSEVTPDISKLLPSVSSSVMITIPTNNIRIEKKLNKMEFNYHDGIIEKSILSHKKFTTITYILEDDMNSIQSFIVEMNALEELVSLRYILNDAEEH